MSLEKLDTILDLAVPEDYLKYKILLAWDSVIAPSLQQYKLENKGTYQFFITKDGEEQFVKFNGWYQSYNGSEMTEYSFVKPKKVEVIVYG